MRRMKYERWHTVNEVAEILRVHRATVYRLIKKRRIPSIRVGCDYRVSSVRLKELMESWPTSNPIKHGIAQAHSNKNVQQS
jgi:excisionase family DNA binding protein